MKAPVSHYIGGDSNYHDRHARRTLRRADAIGRSLLTSQHSRSSILDVGCNRGLTSAYLLSTGIVDEVVGVELDSSTVMPELRSDSRFSLVESDISDIDLDRQFDVVIYGAVHHHIIRNYGLGAAVRVLHNLVDHANHALYFETGHISEGGRWGWQRSIRRYFRTDEEHLFYLAKCIEPRMSGFSIIGKFWIHGVRRWLIRFDLKSTHNDSLLNRKFPIRTDAQQYIRSHGRHKQELQPLPSDLHDSPTEFAVREDVEEKVFTKRYVHHQGSATGEFAIGQAVTHPWAVAAKTIEPDSTLTFPYVDGLHLSAFRSAPRPFRARLASQLVQIWMEAYSTRLPSVRSFLLPRKNCACLLDVVDIHANNVVVGNIGGKPIIRVIDFEPHSNHNLWRNKIHFARMTLSLRQKPLWVMHMMATGYAQGLGHCLRYQFRNAVSRIADRQPSILSILLSETRSLTGRLLGAIPPFKEK